MQSISTAESAMRDFDKALSDISAIRSQIAAATAFRGYGPTALAATGGLALLTTILQALFLGDPTGRPLIFVAGWVATACVSVGIIWVEMQGRSRRLHSDLADAMIHNAIEQFLPAAAAGALLALFLLRFAPEGVWMLPGLWQIVVSLGIFASVRSLPRGVVLAAAWYFVAGSGVLMLASGTHELSPWTMGLPFVVGQLVLAAILHLASGHDDVEE
jgi:hypothetical protein